MRSISWGQHTPADYTMTASARKNPSYLRADTGLLGGLGQTTSPLHISAFLPINGGNKIPSSIFPQGLIESLGFVWHFGNMKCYVTVKYHYLELPPSPAHAVAADAGEKWLTGKTPAKLNIHVHWWSLLRPPHRNRSDFYHSIYPVQGQCRAIQESFHPFRRVQLSCWQTRGRENVSLQWLYLKSVAVLNHASKHPTRKTGVFSLNSSLKHHHTTVSPPAGSIFTGAQHKKSPKPYTTQHVLTLEGGQATSISYKVWLSPFLALLVSKPPTRWRDRRTQDAQAQWAPSSRHILEQGWETKQSRSPNAYASAKP